MCLIIHPIARTSLPVISIVPYTSRNSCQVSVSGFRMTGGDECHTGFQYQGADFYDSEMQKLVPRNEKCLNSGGEYVEK